MDKENPRNEPDAAAERTVEELADHGDKVEGQIDEIRSDWDNKEADPSVPGAVPLVEDDDDEDGSAGEEGGDEREPSSDPPG